METAAYGALFEIKHNSVKILNFVAFIYLNPLFFVEFHSILAMARAYPDTPVRVDNAVEWNTAYSSVIRLS